MDPAGTVDSFSLSNPTPNPHPTTHTPSSHLSSSAEFEMEGQKITMAGLAEQMQQLMAFNLQIQQQLNLLMSGGIRADSGNSAQAGGPFVAPTQAVQSELAPAAPADTPPFPPSSPKTISHAPVVNVKVATPDTFTGNLAKSEEFINSLYLYFYGKQGMTDEQKITFALSYMKEGTAGPWSRRKIKQYSKQGKIPTWDSFLEDFRNTFSDPDPKSTARHKLRKLKQGTNSADEYVASFRESMDETGYNDDALADMFEEGLTQELVNMIYTLPEFCFPKTLEDWMSQAMKFDRQHRRKEGKQKHAASKTTTTSSHAKPPSAQSTNSPRQTALPGRLPSTSSEVVPMEVDKNWKRAGPKGVCYKCRQPGHFARDCQSRVDINAMDYESMKAHFRKELEEDNLKEKQAKEAKEKQDF